MRRFASISLRSTTCQRLGRCACVRQHSSLKAFPSAFLPHDEQPQLQPQAQTIESSADRFSNAPGRNKQTQWDKTHKELTVTNAAATTLLRNGGSFIRSMIARARLDCTIHLGETSDSSDSGSPRALHLTGPSHHVETFEELIWREIYRQDAAKLGNTPDPNHAPRHRIRSPIEKIYHKLLPTTGFSEPERSQGPEGNVVKRHAIPSAAIGAVFGPGRGNITVLEKHTGCSLFYEPSIKGDVASLIVRGTSSQVENAHVEISRLVKVWENANGALLFLGEDHEFTSDTVTLPTWLIQNWRKGPPLLWQMKDKCYFEVLENQPVGTAFGTMLLTGRPEDVNHWKSLIPSLVSDLDWLRGCPVGHIVKDFMIDPATAESILAHGDIQALQKSNHADACQLVVDPLQLSLLDVKAKVRRVRLHGETSSVRKIERLISERVDNWTASVDSNVDTSLPLPRVVSSIVVAQRDAQSLMSAGIVHQHISSMHGCKLEVIDLKTKPGHQVITICGSPSACRSAEDAIWAYFEARNRARNVNPPKANLCSVPPHSGVSVVKSDAHAERSSTNQLAQSQIDEGRQTPAPSRLAGLRGLTGRRASVNGLDSGHERSGRLVFGSPSSEPIRARFAPSPTGYMHLGSLRTALFNKLAVEATDGGAFILRVEDTDQSRLVPDAEERILKDLKWAGLTWDEGPDCGGPHGPYRQSDRLDIYKAHAQQLLEQGHAYRCFCTPAELDAQRQELHSAGQPTVYSKTCRSIPAEEAEKRAAAGESHVLRFKGDMFGRPSFRDVVYGLYRKNEDEEDFVLLKADGFPTYHLANVVDDHLMKITHVIRGEEWLISTPKHIALYQAFGWEPPQFAHLGLLANDDGSKLSKRNAALGIDTLRESGIAAVPLLRWLASLGSSFTASKPRRENSIRSLKDIAEALSFKFTRGAIRLDNNKLTKYATEYITMLLETSVPAQSNDEAAVPKEDENPFDSLTAKEYEYLLEHFIRPLLLLIHKVTASRPEKVTDLTWPHPSWSAEKTLRPHFHNVSPDDPPLEVLRILKVALRTTLPTLPTPAEVISTKPYVFWFVPKELRQVELAKWTIKNGALPKPVFRLVQQLYSADGKKSEEIISQIGGTLQLTGPEYRGDADGEKELTRTNSHALVRMVATGTAAAGPNTGLLRQLLPLQSWYHNSRQTAAVVACIRAAEERGDEGPVLLQKWLDKDKTTKERSLGEA